MKNKLLISLVLFSLTLYSCGPDKIPLNEYMAHIENVENGLKVKKDLELVEMVVQFRPPEYKIIKSFGWNEIDYETHINLMQEYENGLEFLFTIKPKENIDLLKTDFNSMNSRNRIKYLSSDAQNDFLLVNGNDTLKCDMYHFERLYNLDSRLQFLLGFSKPEKVKDIKIIYRDRCWGFEEQMFEFKAKKINNLPRVK